MFTMIVIVPMRNSHMKSLKYIKSNICTIGMIVGILVITSLFLIPLEEHWWGIEKNPAGGWELQPFRLNIVISLCGWNRTVTNLIPDICESNLLLTYMNSLSSGLTLLGISIKFSLTFFVYAFQTPPPANSSWVI